MTMNFTAVYIVFLLISIVYRIRRLTKSYSGESKPGKVHSSLSFAILLCLALLVFVGAIAEYFYYCVILHSREVNLLISIIGFLMYAVVIPIRSWAAKTLGQQMSSDIKIMEKHRLVKEGPYSYLRHPLALCVIIEVFGLALIPNSYYSFLVALFVFFPFMLYRIYSEEKALIEKFGQEYIDYKKMVYAFVPIKRFQ